MATEVKATFDVKTLETLIDGEEVVEVRNQIWDTFAKDPLFAFPTEELDIEQQRGLTIQQTKRIHEYAFPMTTPARRLAVTHALGPRKFGFSLLHGTTDGVSEEGGWGNLK